MDFVSAAVKRDKVRRMVEKGSIKKLLKKKEEAEEESQEKDADLDIIDSNANGVKQEEIVEESNGCAEDKAAGDDASSQPEPSVVFL